MNSLKTTFTTILLLMSLSYAAEEKKAGFVINITEAKKVLGFGWSTDKELVVDNENDIKKYSGLSRTAIEALYNIIKPHGGVAFASFSFSRTVPPLDSVTIRIFKFSSPEKADAYRILKYENDKATKLYKKTETQSAIIYDSLQTKKRIIFKGLFWITCGHIQNNNLHIKVLEKCVSIKDTPQAAKTQEK